MRNCSAFKTEKEAQARAELLNKTKYLHSRIKVAVKKMTPFFVLVGVANK